MEEIARCSGTLGNAYALPVEAAQFLAEHGGDYHKTFIPGILERLRHPSDGRHRARFRLRRRRHAHDRDVGRRRLCDQRHQGVGHVRRIADFIMVFAKTDPASGHNGISCILVEGDSARRVRGKSEELMGMHGLEDCQVIFENVRVPARNLIGTENARLQDGDGQFQLFSRLMMSSMALGMAQAAMEDAIAYAKTRTAVRLARSSNTRRCSSCWPTCRWTSPRRGC